MKILVTAEVDKAIANLNKTEQATNKTGAGFKDFAKQIAGYTTAAGLAVDVGKKVISSLVDLGKKSVVLAAGFETARTSWGVLLGDMEDGVDMFAEIQSLAARTPLSFESVEQGARTLKQFGLATEDVIPTIKMLGDVSMGNAERLRGLSIVYGQVMSTGRLMGQDLLQLINQGFNPLQVISKKTGESIAELKTRMEKGGISAQEVADAFKTATSQGGLFYQMMDKTAETTAGKWSTAQDNFRNQLAELGENVIPIVNAALDGYNRRVSEMESRRNVGKVIAGEAKSYENITDAIREVKGQIEELSPLNYATSEEYENQKAILEQQLKILMPMGMESARRASNAEKQKKAEKDRLAEIEKVQKALKKQEEAEKKIEELNEKAIANNPYKNYVEDMAKYRNEQSKIRPEIREFTGELEDQMEATREWPELLSKQDQAWQDYIANLEAATEQYNAQIELADAWQEAFSSAWLGVGEALAEGESGWVAIGEAAKDAFAKILQGLAAELAARSALALLKGQFGKAAAAAAASATTYVAAGAIQAMADGGEGTVTKPTLFLAGEAGPEDYSFVPKSKGGMAGKNTVVNNYTVYNVEGSMIAERSLNKRIASAASQKARGF